MPSPQLSSYTQSTGECWCHVAERLRAGLAADERTRLEQRDAADVEELEAPPASLSDAASVKLPGPPQARFPLGGGEFAVLACP